MLGRSFRDSRFQDKRAFLGIALIRWLQEGNEPDALTGGRRDNQAETVDLVFLPPEAVDAAVQGLHLARLQR